MDWANESYVRVYRRKTTTGKLLGWEGNAVLRMLLTEFDRSGYLELDGLTPVEVASIHTEMPIEIVQVGMSRLLDREVLTVVGGRLFMPNYLEAQTTSKSEVQRKREQREREAAEQRSTAGNVTNRDAASPKHRDPGDVTNRDSDVTNRDADVTNREEMSRSVTAGHERSRNVPLSLIPDPDPDPEEDRSSPGGDSSTSPASKFDGCVRRVFDHWVQAMGKPSTVKLTPQRSAKVKSRLREGYTVEQLCQAVDGCRLSPFHMGDNDRGQPYTDLETILRSGKTVEEHAARLSAPQSKPAEPTPLHRRALT